MSSYNKVILMGNVVADIDLRKTPNGTSVTDLRLAVDDSRSKGNNTVFVDVTLWERTAEVASEYLKKGSPVLIEGRLCMDEWETQEGVKRSKLKIIGERMKLVGSRRDNGYGDRDDVVHPQVDTSNENPSSEKDGEDIPF